MRLLLVLLVACNNDPNATYKIAARDELSKTYSCPKDRIGTTARPELKPFDLLYGPADKPAPEIAADPGRLKIWQQQQQELQDGYNRDKVIETTGCDQHVFYVCGIGESTNHTQVYICRVPKYPPT